MFVEKLNKEHISYIVDRLCPEEEFNNADYNSIRITKHVGKNVQDHIKVSISLVENGFVMYDDCFATIFQVEDEENLQENYKKLMLDIFGEEYKNYLENTDNLEA